MVLRAVALSAVAIPQRVAAVAGINAGVRAVRQVSMLAAIAACTAGLSACVRDASPCEEVLLESGRTVSVARSETIGALTGGRGPNGPAMGIGVDPESVKNLAPEQLLRLTLWDWNESSKPNGVECERSTLMQEPVVACSASIDGSGLVLWAQFEPPQAADDDLAGYAAATGQLVLQVRPSIECDGKQ